MNRLTERDWKSKCAGYPWNVHPVKDIDDLQYYKKLAEYEDAEEQGFLLNLRIAIGSTFYTTFDYCICGISEEVVKSIKICENDTIIETTTGNLYSIASLGKHIFKTKEEAESAILFCVN